MADVALSTGQGAISLSSVLARLTLSRRSFERCSGLELRLARLIRV